jgi:hypothetical protein
MHDINSLTLPIWAKPYTCDFPSLAKKAEIDKWRVERSLFIWSKNSVDYVCRNMDDVRRIVNMLETTWNEHRNPGWTLEQSIDAELMNLSADKEETEEKLNRINARIKALKTWKEGS